MILKIDGEVLRVEDVDTDFGMPVVTTEDGDKYYVAENSEEAGKLVIKYYKDLAKNSRNEFVSLIGKKRLTQWALGESDEFGIDSFEDFLEKVADVPEEHWATEDGSECCIEAPTIEELMEEYLNDEEREDEAKVEECWTLYEQDLSGELGFVPTVAYRMG